MHWVEQIKEYLKLEGLFEICKDLFQSSENLQYCRSGNWEDDKT